jgi:hypothetical protein
LCLTQNGGQTFGVAILCNYAGSYEHPGALHPGTDYGSGLGTQKDCVGRSLSGFAFKGGAGWPVADYHELRGGQLRPDLRHGTDEMNAALLFHQATHKQHGCHAIAEQSPLADMQIDSYAVHPQLVLRKSERQSLSADMF